jgi:hypothetical protein
MLTEGGAAEQQPIRGLEQARRFQGMACIVVALISVDEVWTAYLHVSWLPNAGEEW